MLRVKLVNPYCQKRVDNTVKNTGSCENYTNCSSSDTVAHITQITHHAHQDIEGHCTAGMQLANRDLPGRNSAIGNTVKFTLAYFFNLCHKETSIILFSRQRILPYLQNQYSSCDL